MVVAWGGVGGEMVALALNQLKGLPGFKVVHLNIRSLTHKINQIKLDVPSSGIDILTISKTWLNDNIENKLTSIPNYNLIRYDRQTVCLDGSTKSGGGLGIYHKTTIKVDATNMAALNASNEDIEMQWVVIMRPNTKKILLGNVLSYVINGASKTN